MLITIDTKWVESIRDFDNGTKASLYDAIFDFMTDNEVNLPKDTLMAFSILIPLMNDVKSKRTRLAERSRINGQKGGRKPMQKAKEEPKKPIGFDRFLEMPQYMDRCERLQRLDEWKQTHTPYIYANLRPLTQKEFDCLVKKYNAEQICDTLLQIENRKDLRKRYTDPYRTLLNWLKNNYGNT